MTNHPTYVYGTVPKEHLSVEDQSNMESGVTRPKLAHRKKPNHVTYNEVSDDPQPEQNLK